MLVAATEADTLTGEIVTFAGKLSSMTRAEAAELIRSRGGAVTRTVNKRTSIVVVGKESWPPRKDGRVATELSRARRLQNSGKRLTIYHETEFLRHLGLDAAESV